MRLQVINDLVPVFVAVATFAIAGICGMDASKLCAQEFKIETLTYLGDSDRPIGQNTTLFSNGLVYDFQVEPQTQELLETRIYESRKRTMVLLDPARKASLEMLDLRLLQMVDGLRRELSQNKATQFLVEEQFTEENDLTGNWVRLSSPSVSFRMQGERPKNVNYFPLYIEYLDNFTRLKASTINGFPPFPRMKLNESIRKLGWIPIEIQVEMEKNIFFKEGIEQTSKHTLIDGLSRQDNERIANAKQQWMSFKKLSLLDYREVSKKKVLSKKTPEQEKSDSRVAEATSQNKRR